MSKQSKQHKKPQKPKKPSSQLSPQDSDNLQESILAQNSHISTRDFLRNWKIVSSQRCIVSRGGSIVGEWIPVSEMEIKTETRNIKSDFCLACGEEPDYSFTAESERNFICLICLNKNFTEEELESLKSQMTKL